MNTNNVLTFILYALFAGLICVAGYKACQMKEKQAKVAQEDAEFQQSLRDLGYLEEDSTGSQFSEDGSSYGDPTPSYTVSDDGIEDDYESPVASTSPKTTSPKPVTTPSSSSPAPKTSTNRVSNLDTEAYNSADGRYRVIAGSFTVLDGARREMERLIKMGYHDAEVGKFNRGKYAVVIVKRTNSLSEANSIKDKLARQGIEASVIARKRK